MRRTVRWTVVLAATLMVQAMMPSAQAQAPDRTNSDSSTQAGQSSYVRVVIGSGPVRTTVSVPDGGSALAGGYSSMSESRSEYGGPIVGKAPYASRGLRNVGYGRRSVSGRAVVSVRIIDLREEEYRQTGYRRP
jgi:type II secretory pathway component GspD/PulD (secretin)